MNKPLAFVFLLFTIVSIVSASSAQFNVQNALDHLSALQNIAYTVGNGNRAAGTSGYNASADYVFEYLKENTNFSVSVQHFPFYTYSVVESPIMRQVSPASIPYIYKTDFTVVRYSSSGEATAPVQDVGNGCTLDSFNNFVAGNIAVAILGDCHIGVKVQNAIASNAAAVFLYNISPESGISVGSLENPENIIVFGMSYTLARSFLDATTAPTFYVKSVIESNLEFTSNIIADTTSGDPNSIVVFGAHLDSVPAGPGMNDDGSGSATNLEYARAFSDYLTSNTIQNKVRFCWWGAEELGKLGSRYYVNDQVASGEISKIAAYYNYDMVGSPNYMRGVYDGDTAPDGLQAPSVKLQEFLIDYFEFNEITYVLTPFTTGSDYYYFLQNGVPCSGLFTGTSTIKSMEYRTIFGGVANAGFDPCYHQPCDTIENISAEVLDQNGKSGLYSLIEVSKIKNLREFLGTPSERASYKYLRGIQEKVSDLHDEC